MKIDMIADFSSLSGFFIFGAGAGLVVGAALGGIQFVINRIFRFINNS